jgi:hypothetical protein
VKQLHFGENLNVLRDQILLDPFSRQQNQNHKTKSMRQTAFKFLTILALAVLVAGCASNNLLDKENAATGAGFKIITPTKAEQMALLQKLPADKVTPITYGGKPYYILPDLANNRAYIGGPKQYQVYQQFRQKQKMNSESYVATPDSVTVVEINAMNWGEWDGWGPDGLLGEPGWY